MIKNFIKKIMYRYIGLIFKIKSAKNYLFTIFEKDHIVKSVETNNNKYCIFVFYQNGVREDVVSILKELKEQNVSVILVSNKTLSEFQTQKLELYCDVIISRPNFGRDFGAYKRGMDYIYKKCDIKSLERLIFLNDSIFYSIKGLKVFVTELLNSKFDVIGATENLEIKRHIGSFCISISGNILRDSRFMKYWKKYRNSDVRPIVIERGEMALSQVLFKISRESSVKILYDFQLVKKSWCDNTINTNNISNLTRSADSPSTWKNINFKELISDFIGNKSFQINNSSPKKLKSTNERNYCFNNTSALSMLKKYVNDIELTDIELTEFNNYFLYNLLAVSIIGSQIHQNNILFYFLGMPIIKNDCFFRGVFNVNDLYRVCELLPDDEKDNFINIQMSKPYGKEFLKDFDYYAYMCGYL